MARLPIIKPEQIDDPVVKDIFAWVSEMEGAVPNHFYMELHFPEFMKAKLGATKVLWEMGELSMPEIQHIGILVSRANGCPYCTGAFCTILNDGLNTAEAYVKELAENGVDSVTDARLRALLNFALKVNDDPKAVTDRDISELKELGLAAKGVVQLIHLVSDFAAYNRLNIVLQTDYDYRDLWRQPLM
ncbi:MAG: carboxymuconolactone decarboxylase family protein [Pseudomonadales bacterium]